MDQTGGQTSVHGSVPGSGSATSYSPLAAVPACAGVPGQDAIHRPARVLEDGEGLRGLLVVGEAGDLLHRRGERHRGAHQLLHPGARPVLGDLPGLAELVRVLLDVTPALVGQREAPSAPPLSLDVTSPSSCSCCSTG